MNNIAIIGAGAWGTALAIQAQRAGRRVTLWARDPDRARDIAATRRNPNLPGATLPVEITVTNTMLTADLLLLAVPVQHMRAVATGLPPGPVAICAKGVELGSLNPDHPDRVLPAEEVAWLARILWASQ